MDELYEKLSTNAELDALCKEIKRGTFDSRHVSQSTYAIFITPKVNYMRIAIEKTRLIKDNVIINFRLNNHIEAYYKPYDQVLPFLLYKLKNNLFSVTTEYQVKDLPLNSLKQIFPDIDIPGLKITVKRDTIPEVKEIKTLQTQIDKLKKEIEGKKKEKLEYDRIKVSYQLNKIDDGSAVVILKTQRDIENFMKKI